MSMKPWMTSEQLIDSVKRKISVPLSQNTFSQLDVLAFANEEMFISQVPSVLTYHSEYFVTYKILPLVQNVSRYPIPERAIGMKVRDVFWMDQTGNMYDMAQVDEHDRAFFQRNLGSNQSIHKFFFEGNQIVLTPGIVNSPSGYLVLVFYIRPNQLVKNNRAATIVNFQQNFIINNSLISALDTFTISPNASATTPNTLVPFTAVNTLGGTITAIDILSASSTSVTSANHQLTQGQTVVIAGSNSNPSINGTYTVDVLSPDTFEIQIQIATAGTTGTFTSPNQFQIAATSALTAANLAASIQSLNIIDSTMAVSNKITLSFQNIYAQLSTSNTTGFVINTETIGINFDSLPSTYTDDETNQTENLFQNGSIIDLLQERPGHSIYLYDIEVPTNGISGTVLTFNVDQLLVPTGTVNLAASTGTFTSPTGTSVEYILAPLVPGDYMCLANEAIIPFLPPDLHNGLAERTAARILAALGDQAGLAASQAKIQEIDQRQGPLMSTRSDGNTQKVTNRGGSLLRFSKSGLFRRW